MLVKMTDMKMNRGGHGLGCLAAGTLCLRPPSLGSGGDSKCLVREQQENATACRPDESPRRQHHLHHSFLAARGGA